MSLPLTGTWVKKLSSTNSTLFSWVASGQSLAQTRRRSEYCPGSVKQITHVSCLRELDMFVCFREWKGNSTDTSTDINNGSTDICRKGSLSEWSGEHPSNIHHSTYVSRLPYTLPIPSTISSGVHKHHSSSTMARPLCDSGSLP